MTTTAEVMLWGRRIGGVSLDQPGGIANFEYDAAFINAAIEPSPIVMPVRPGVYRFTALAREAFKGMPGMLADSLPDKFGNAVIDAWLAQQGRDPSSFDAVERLCYLGTRGMGALEFRPATPPGREGSRTLDVGALVELAGDVLAQRSGLASRLDGDEQELRDIISVGTSAGGARAKAVIAFNPTTLAVRSGQVEAEHGFEHWLIKFDGVASNGDKELSDPSGYGRIEYAYSLMARAAGIDMHPTRLLEEHDRAHFMTRRFDRTKTGGKLHMQSLGALAHFDLNQPAAYSYEQALHVMRQLGLSRAELVEQFRRTVFNVIGRNHDDHVKNISFLMNQAGIWSLSPAYDVSYSYNPKGDWTRQHQLSVNGKRGDFTRADLQPLSDLALLKVGEANGIIDEVAATVANWPAYAHEAGIPESSVRAIATLHRTLA